MCQWIAKQWKTQTILPINYTDQPAIQICFNGITKKNYIREAYIIFLIQLTTNCIDIMSLKENLLVWSQSMVTALTILYWSDMHSVTRSAFGALIEYQYSILGFSLNKYWFMKSWSSLKTWLVVNTVERWLKCLISITCV